MHLLLNILEYGFTAAVGLLLLAAIAKLCYTKAHHKPLPSYWWSSLLQVALFFIGCVIFLMTHSHGGQAIPILVIAIATMGLFRSWKAAKAERSQRSI